MGGFGTQNAGVSAGGRSGSSAVSAQTLHYDGSSWSTHNNMNVARCALRSSGVQNSGVVFGGTTGLTCTEEYNGTTWSVANPMITGRHLMGSSKAASSNNEALTFGGGTPSNTAATE